MTLPSENVLGVVADFLTVNPTVDAGYYAYVTDLCSGEHTVKFSGELPPKSESRGDLPTDDRGLTNGVW